MFSTLILFAAGVSAQYDIWEQTEGAAYYLGSSGWEDPEGPGPALQSACSLEENAGYKWEEQNQMLMQLGQTVGGENGRKRAVSAWEMFGGDQEAFDHFIHQFHHDEQGRKRSTKMKRYHEEMEGGKLVQILDNWNEPQNLANVADPDSEPTFIVQQSSGEKKYAKVNAANPSKQVTVKGHTLVDCGLGKSKDECKLSGNEGDFCCLISRGEISFIDKVNSCISAGGKSAVIFNNKVDEPDAELGASLGDDRVAIPVVTLSYKQGNEVKSAYLGEKVTVGVPPPAGSGFWLPLTNHKDQGSCGDCYLFAAMTSVTMWTNLLLWEEAERNGKQFSQKDQFWMDTTTMTHCYQDMLDNEPNPTKAALDVQFSSSSDTPSGSEDEVKALMHKILQQFKDSTTSTATPLSRLREWQIREVESGDCGYDCYQVEVPISVYRSLVRGGNSAFGKVSVSAGFEATVEGETYTISSVKAARGARVCGGGWHNVVLDQWYDEQQQVRLGKQSTGVRFVNYDQTNDAEISRAKYARGPSQKRVDSTKCPKNDDVSDVGPVLYRFDPHFDMDEESRNPPTRDDGPLNTYRPLYMPRSAKPGSVAFADKVRSVLSAAQYGPVMIGVAVCDSMFRVGRDNSVTNPYYDLECTDAINHIVNVIGFHCKGLPAEGQSGAGDKWWEECSLLVQNTWGTWGNLGQAWVRVDFTLNWSLGIVPLVRRPNTFKNPYLPSKRLEELRFGRSFDADDYEYTTGQSLPLVPGDAESLVLSRPVMPEVAFKEAVVTLVVVSETNVGKAPTSVPAIVEFAALYNNDKYFADDVEQDVLNNADIASDNSGAREEGRWVVWATEEDSGYTAGWQATTLETRGGNSISTFELKITIDMQLTKMAAAKPASHWQRVILRMLDDQAGLIGDQKIAMRDFYLVIDEEGSAVFRDDGSQTTAASALVPAIMTVLIASIATLF